MCKFSIIVPCYNIVERVEPLFKMLYTDEFTDYEVIFVDDCSPDASYEKMKSCALNYANYRVFQTPQNGGPGPARNLGIQLAEGENILFCDSDDVFDIMILHRIDVFLKEHNDADMLVFPHEIERKQVVSRNDTYSQYDNGAVVVPRDVVTGCSGPVAKLFKREIIVSQGLSFPHRMTGEDTCFITEYTVYAKKIYKMDVVYYRYIMNSGSITHRRRRPLEEKTTFEILQPIYREHFPEIEMVMFVNAHLLTRAKEMCDSCYTTRQIKQWFKQANTLYPGWLKKLDLRKESLYRKCIYFAMYHNVSWLIKLIMWLRAKVY